MAARGPPQEEEDEEEELLQRALEEQAARDVTSGPPPNKPVPSASRPPPNKPPPPNKQDPPNKTPSPLYSSSSGPPRRIPPPTPPKRAPPQAPPIEDEEESEAELLSNSSEDEVSPQAKGNGGAAQAKATGGQEGGEEDELEWDEVDEEEPESWKEVNHTELVRRVRQMRETRGAPAARKKGRTPTLVDAGTPRSEDLIDPLGLGTLDIRSLTIIPKAKSGDSSPALSAASSERGSGKRSFLRRKSTKAPVVEVPQKDDEESTSSQPEPPVIRDQATRERLNYLSEKFDPKFYLSHVHKYTPPAELEGAGEALKRDLLARNDELKKLVKENFDCFISCKTTIDEIHSKLQQIESSEGGGTSHLSVAIREVDIAANRAFAPLLERQSQVERIRSVQGMLQRFRTLFNLPSIIRSHISKGEYDQAIQEYKKAKSLELYSHVGILKRVLEEVDKIVQEFKDTLYKSMEDPHLETSQLETTIRLLLELEPECDPVWYYLTIQDRKIRGLLEGCSLEHEARMEAFNGRVRDRVMSDARWKQIQRESNKASDVDYALLLGENDRESTGTSLSDSTAKESDALLRRLIRRLTTVIVHHVPLFWTLALSIFSGKFTKGTGSANSSLLRVNTVSSLQSNEVLDRSRYTTHTLEEVEMMVHCIISLYESKVQVAFLALAEANVLRPYMREAVAEISRGCIVLQGNDSAPNSADIRKKSKNFIGLPGWLRNKSLLPRAICAMLHAQYRKVQMLLAMRTEVTRVFVSRICTLMHSATSGLMNDEDWEPVAAVERGSSPFAISSLPLRFQEMMASAIDHLTEMLDRLNKDGVHLHEDMISQLHQMQDTVRYTFFECFLTLAENLEKVANELAYAATADDQGGKEKAEDGGGHEKFLGLIAGVEVISFHQRLLMVLSNIGFCHAVILPELSRKFEHVWAYEGANGGSKGTGPGGNMATSEDAEAALVNLERKVLGQYNITKARDVQLAAEAYLLDDGHQWAAAPPVRAFRDSVMDLMHPLVTMHAEVFAGAKPFLEKAINSVVEALMDALVNIFTENKTTVFRVLDLNGYCQLTLEISYLQAVLEVYLTAQARERVANYRELLLEKVLELVGDVSEYQSHSRRGGSQDGMEGNGGMTTEDVLGLAEDHISHILPHELKRTRLNVLCFMENLPENNSLHASRRGSKSSQRQHVASANNMSGRKSSGSSLTDSESGRSSGLPPVSPSASDTIRAADRYARTRNDSRRASYRGQTRYNVDTDELT